MRPVTVQFLKNPDITHWGFTASYLGEDEHGTWMGVPRGSERWKGEDRVRPTREDAVFCAPTDRWWHLHYNGSTTEFSHFVDIVTPPRWVSDHRYEMIDLDLDVVVRHDGSVEVHDEDEFALHQKRYSYGDELVSGAMRATREVVAALERREEPFFETAATWLASLQSRG